MSIPKYKCEWEYAGGGSHRPILFEKIPYKWFPWLGGWESLLHGQKTYHYTIIERMTPDEVHQIFADLVSEYNEYMERCKEEP